MAHETGRLATEPRSEAARWTAFVTDARKAGLWLDGWDADYEGVRLFLASLDIGHERSILLDRGDF